ncbi:hypothetical protein ACOSQ3_009958 [Xanthoceras sorbifolium]
MVSERGSIHRDRAKSSTEFHSEIHELISSQEATNAENAAKTDTRFEQLIDLIAQSNARFDQITQDLQVLRLQQNNQPISSYIRQLLTENPITQFVPQQTGILLC